MKLILLQSTSQINGMTDVIFTVGDMITIIGGIIALIFTFFKLKYDQKNDSGNIKTKLDTLEKGSEAQINDLKNDISEERLTRHAIKKELKLDIKEINDALNHRINKTHDKMEKDRADTLNEFKGINETLHKIVGMLESKK